MVRWLPVLGDAWRDNNNDPVAASSFAALFESIERRSIGNNTPPRAGRALGRQDPARLSSGGGGHET